MEQQTALQEAEATFVLPTKDNEPGHYELLVLLPGGATEQEAATTFDEVKRIVQSFNGTITFEANLGRRSLGYTIAGSRSGSYVVVEFDILKNRVSELNEKLRIRKDVARFLIVTKRVKSAEELAEDERIAKKIESRRKAKMEADIDTMEKESSKAPAAKTRIAREEKRDHTTEAKPATPAKPKSMEEIDKEIEKLLSDDLGDDIKL